MTESATMNVEIREELRSIRQTLARMLDIFEGPVTVCEERPATVAPMAAAKPKPEEKHDPQGPLPAPKPAEPAAPAPAPKPVEPAPAPAPAPAARKLDDAGCRAEIARMVGSPTLTPGQKEVLRSVFREFGAAKLVDVPQDKREDMIARLEVALTEGGKNDDLRF